VISKSIRVCNVHTIEYVQYHKAEKWINYLTQSVHATHLILDLIDYYASNKITRKLELFAFAIMFRLFCT